jgi:hypothetical protein
MAMAERFEYSFHLENWMSFSGEIEGTVLSDGNMVAVDSIVSLKDDGVLYDQKSLAACTICHPYLVPVMSFDGKGMDIIVAGYIGRTYRGFKIVHYSSGLVNITFSNGSGNKSVTLDKGVWTLTKK